MKASKGTFFSIVDVKHESKESIATMNKAVGTFEFFLSVDNKQISSLLRTNGKITIDNFVYIDDVKYCVGCP